MDVSAVAGMASAMAQTRTESAAGVLVLRKALDLQAAGATQLLQALPQPASNPAHLGQNIDVKA